MYLQELVLAIKAQYTDWLQPAVAPARLLQGTAMLLHDASVVAPVLGVADRLSRNRRTYAYVLDNSERVSLHRDNWGRDISAPPFRRRRFGAVQLGAVPFRRRTFRHRFIIFFIFRIMKKKQ